jgi:hypothetical protein
VNVEIVNVFVAQIYLEFYRASDIHLGSGKVEEMVIGAADDHRVCGEEARPGNR